MTINMTNFAGHKTKGRDYSTALRDLLPEIIGTTPKTMHQIAETSGRDHETVRRIIGKVRNQVHISAWSMAYQHPTALYKWGSDQTRRARSLCRKRSEVRRTGQQSTEEKRQSRRQSGGETRLLVPNTGSADWP